MSMTRHGLSIGIERIDDSVFLTLKAIGKLSHDDYQAITPMLDAALQGVDHPKIKVLFDGREFEGWEMRAAWDDFKLGVKHGREFEKIAIVSSQHWMELGGKIGGWFVSGEVQVFDTEAAAIHWLQS